MRQDLRLPAIEMAYDVRTLVLHQHADLVCNDQSASSPYLSQSHRSITFRFLLFLFMMFIIRTTFGSSMYSGYISAQTHTHTHTHTDTPHTNTNTHHTHTHRHHTHHTHTHTHINYFVRDAHVSCKKMQILHRSKHTTFPLQRPTA